MNITTLDHLVLTVKSIEKTCAFYEQVLGMQAIVFADNRKALRFGQYKFNLHQSGKEFKPNARCATAGSADFCLITDMSSEEIRSHLALTKIDIEQGPVPRSGANGPITSYYFRDPDGNLIELATYNQ